MPDDSGKKVIVHRKRRVFDDFYDIDEVEVSFEGHSGKMLGPFRRLTFERGDSVAALVLKRNWRSNPTQAPKVLLVNQFKYPVYVHDDGWITETVAGMVDPGETREESIRRELREEIGYEVQELEFVASFYSSPGGSSERVFLFYCEVDDSCRVPGAGGGLAAEGEDIQMVEYELPEFFAKLAGGVFVDPKIIISGLWLQARLAARDRQSPP